MSARRQPARNSLPLLQLTAGSLNTVPVAALVQPLAADTDVYANISGGGATTSGDAYVIVTVRQAVDLMAKLTWRGPDDYEAGETPPSSCTWNGITFPVGVAVEVDEPDHDCQGAGNRMFKVEDGRRPCQPRRQHLMAPCRNGASPAPRPTRRT